MVEYSVEVGKKGHFQKRNVKFHYFDSLAKAKKFAREQLSMGNAIGIDKADKYGEFQPVAVMGDKDAKGAWKNFSTIGKIGPVRKKLKIKKKLKARRNKKMEASIRRKADIIQAQNKKPIWEQIG